ncbi:unnamed protein product [Caenorhabditis brenneri]
MDPQDYQNLLRKTCETQYAVYSRKNPVIITCCNNDYGTPLNSSHFNKNQRNLMKQIYEEEYAALVKSNQKSNYEYWEDKNDDRYYNELLNELDAENQKPIDYPNLTEKILLTISLIISFYISTASPPDFTMYEYVPVGSLCFMFYFLIKEPVTVGFVGRSFIRVSKYHNNLDNFIHQRVKPYDDIRKNHEIRLRIFALDNRKNKWTIIFLTLDIVFNFVMIILAIALKYYRKDTYRSSMFEPDPYAYLWISALSIIFSSVYLKITVDNWEWLQNAKQLFIMTSSEYYPINRKACGEKWREIDEIDYKKYIEQHPKLHSLFWEGKDDIRYYNLLLDEIELEKKKWNYYASITDKMLLISTAIFSLYNNGPKLDENSYGFSSVFSLFFMFYFASREIFQMLNGNRTPFEIESFYTFYLEAFKFLAIPKKDEVKGYEKLKQRIFALNNRACKLNISILVLDVLINVVMIAISFFTLDEKPHYKFLFWKSKDEARYYTEILNNLDKEIKKINYPRIADKVYTILAVSASLYNTNQHPIMWLHLFLFGLAYLYAVFEILIEASSMAIGNRSILEVSLYQDYLK